MRLKKRSYSVFIRAAAVVLKRLPSALFVIVGEGNERPKLEALVKDLRIEKSILFLGARNDIPELVNIFDVAVLCSDPVVETVSNSVLEYMAVSKPVVSTRVGSLPEIIDDGRDGYLVDAGAWQEMGERILRLLQDRDLAKRMGACAREKIETAYNLDRLVRDWESLFERLLANGHSSRDN